jgi:hypothetical protein
MVIVDTSDALLVCPKSSSQKVKDIVSAFKDKNDEMAYTGQTVYRPWGLYTLLEASSEDKIKNIVVLPDNKLSLQLHNHRSEHWGDRKRYGICGSERAAIFPDARGKYFYKGRGEAQVVQSRESFA